MLILVVSDIHGSFKGYWRLSRILGKYKPEKIILLGDLLYGSFDNGEEKVRQLLNLNKERILAVRGNCDLSAESEGLEFELPLRRDIKLNGHMIHMQHHPFSKFDYAKGDICMNGHTHVKLLYKDEEGIVHLNPGSISNPRDDGPGYALIENGQIILKNADTDEEISFINI